MSGIYLEEPEVNRPALQLTGYFDHFDNQRIQIIGYVEYTFLERMDSEEKERIYDQLLACRIPCLIFCRDMRPDNDTGGESRIKLIFRYLSQKR